MNKSKLFTTALILFTSLGLSPQLSASLIIETYESGSANPTTVGGYSMTAFDVAAGIASVDRTSSPNGGEVVFKTHDGSDMFLDRNTSSAYSWWESASSYNVFTTSEHWITLLLPAETYAFSFNVGANMAGATGWLTAEAHDGSMLSKTTFGPIGAPTAPGFGVASSAGSCSAIKSITVDPSFVWGVGNFAINEGGCTTSVPEPASLLLFGVGFLGLGFTRRRTTAIKAQMH
jgi:hypothetical protein